MALVVLGAVFKPPVVGVAAVLGAIYSVAMTSRRLGYAEKKAFRVEERLGGAADAARDK